MKPKIVQGVIRGPADLVARGLINMVKGAKAGSCPRCGGKLRCMACLGKKGGRSRSPRKIQAATRTLRIYRETREVKS